MPPGLSATLAGVARRMAAAADPWWIVGGAATALHGVATPVVDVDLLCGIDDARALIGEGAAAGPPHPRFRSAVFGTLSGSPLAVEVMAGFELRVADRWTPVRFATREPVSVGECTLFVPARAELAVLLRRIGRAKDRHRAGLLMS